MCVYCDLEHSMIDFLRRTERVVVPSYRVKVKRWRGKDRRGSLSFLYRFHDRRSRAQLKAFRSYLAEPVKPGNTSNREFRKLNEKLGDRLVAIDRYKLQKVLRRLSSIYED